MWPKPADVLPADVLTAHQNRTLSICEENIERDIEQNETKKPTSKLQQWRKTGDEVLHSPAVLMIVVVLNCIDCILVLSELVLDVYFIKEMIDTAENTMVSFNALLQDKYPAEFDGIELHSTHEFYNRVLLANLTWNATTSHVYTKLLPHDNMTQGNISTYHVAEKLDHVHVLEPSSAALHFDATDDPGFLEDEVHSIEERIAHISHKLSVLILAILVMYAFIKIFCKGLDFVKHKLEVFDTIIVLVSFTLDVAYMRGLTNYPIESFILILAVMIPWRIIRVLNSLTIAVKDNFHILLKLMYKKNRYHCEKIEYLEATNRNNKNMVLILTKICEANGLTAAQIKTYFDFAEMITEGQKAGATSNPFGACFSRQASTVPDMPSEHMLRQLKLLIAFKHDVAPETTIKDAQTDTPAPASQCDTTTDTSTRNNDVCRPAETTVTDQAEHVPLMHLEAIYNKDEPM